MWSVQLTHLKSCRAMNKPFTTTTSGKFHVPWACTSDACALETRRRFVTERRKKIESRHLNPGFTAWVINSRTNIFINRSYL